MMRLRFGLRLRDMPLGLYSEKIKSWYNIFDFFHYIGQRIGVGSGVGAAVGVGAASLCVVLTQKMFGYGSGSDPFVWPTVYCETKIHIKFLTCHFIETKG
jgi:hypothetical protein